MKEKKWVIRYEDLAGTVATNVDHRVPPGSFLSHADLEAYGGRGFATWTVDPATAMRFDNAEEAFKLWRGVSKTRPRRPDGKPNRPLTVFTVSIERYEG